MMMDPTIDVEEEDQAEAVAVAVVVAEVTTVIAMMTRAMEACRLSRCSTYRYT